MVNMTLKITKGRVSQHYNIFIKFILKFIPDPNGSNLCFKFSGTLWTTGFSSLIGGSGGISNDCITCI